MGDVVRLRRPWVADWHPTDHPARNERFSRSAYRPGETPADPGGDATVRRGSTVGVWPDTDAPGHWRVVDWSVDGGGQTFAHVPDEVGARPLRGLSFLRACELAAKIAARSPGSEFYVDPLAMRLRSNELATRRRLGGKG